MSKKNNYFEDDAKQVDAKRQKRKKQNKGKSVGKIILLLIATIIVLLVLAGVVYKAVNPSFNFMTLIPDELKTVLHIEEEEPAVEELPTEPKPIEIPTLDYMTFDNFKFKAEKQGNSVGSLLNGGLVGNDTEYTYHFVSGKGIYRFSSGSETSSKVFDIDDDICCINLRGGYFYYVNKNDDALYRVKRDSQNSTKIADDVNFAYVYDDTVYYTTKQGKLFVMNVDNLVPVLSYYSNGNDLKFVGISLSRVFFTVTSADGMVKYLTIDNYAHNQVAEFRKSTTNDEIKNMVLENGFLYYYQKQADGEYNLCRQKFGSDKVVTLAEKVDASDYVEINSNRLYYSKLNKNKYSMIEINMNSEKKRTIISVSGVDSSNSLSFFFGSDYNFVIGKKAENGKSVYYASNIYTSSTNVMSFNDGWSY